MADFGNDDLRPGQATTPRSDSGARTPSVSFGAEDSSATGGSIPQRSHYGSDTAYYEPRYQSMGGRRRAGAGIQNIVNSIPLVRNIPGVSDAISPPQDVEIATGARPFLSGVERTAGHSAPYMLAGAVNPSLVSKLVPAAATGAGIEGADAYLAGSDRSDVYSSAARGAVGAGIGALLSPISRQLRDDRRQVRGLRESTQDRQSRVSVGEANIQAAEQHLGRINGEIAELERTYGHIDGPLPGTVAPQRDSLLSRRTDLTKHINDLRTELSSYRSEVDDMAGTLAGGRLRDATVSALPQPLRGLTRWTGHMADTDSSTNAILRALAGGYATGHPVGAVGALAAPYAARYAHRVASNAPEAGRIGTKIFENQVFADPRMRAIINALVQESPEVVPAAANTVSGLVGTLTGR